MKLTTLSDFNDDKAASTTFTDVIPSSPSTKGLDELETTFGKKSIFADMIQVHAVTAAQGRVAAS